MAAGGWQHTGSQLVGAGIGMQTGSVMYCGQQTGMHGWQTGFWDRQAHQSSRARPIATGMISRISRARMPGLLLLRVREHRIQSYPDLSRSEFCFAGNFGFTTTITTDA